MPVEEVDMAVEVQCADALQEFFRTNARVTQVPLAVEFMTEYGQFYLDNASEVQLIVTLANGKHVKGDLTVKSKIKSPDSSVIEAKVEKLALGKYSIKYTPTRTGEHEISVVVKNSGSPDCEAYVL